MELNFTPELQARLEQRAGEHGCDPGEVVQDVVARATSLKKIALLKR